MVVFTQKLYFFVGFPPSMQDFFVKHVPLNARVSGYLDLKSNFLIKNPQNLSKICKKGTHCEILNLNNRRLGRLMVYVI